MTQTVISNEVSSSWPTLYEIGKTILKMDLTAHHTRRGGRRPRELGQRRGGPDSRRPRKPPKPPLAPESLKTTDPLVR